MTQGDSDAVSADEVRDQGNDAAAARSVESPTERTPLGEPQQEQPTPGDVHGQRPASYTVHPRRGGRGRQTVRDMVFSLGAICAAVAVILVITHRPAPNPVRVVQTEPVAAQARLLVAWPVIDPTSKLAQWRATSARIESATALSGGPVFTLGYVTDSGEWFGVKEVGLPAGDALRTWADRELASAGDVRTSALRSTATASYLVYGTGTGAQQRALLTAMGLRP